MEERELDWKMVSGAPTNCLHLPGKAGSRASPEQGSGDVSEKADACQS